MFFSFIYKQKNQANFDLTISEKNFISISDLNPSANLYKSCCNQEFFYFYQLNPNKLKLFLFGLILFLSFG